MGLLESPDAHPAPPLAVRPLHPPLLVSPVALISTIFRPILLVNGEETGGAKKKACHFRLYFLVCPAPATEWHARERVTVRWASPSSYMLDSMSMIVFIHLLT